MMIRRRLLTVLLMAPLVGLLSACSKGEVELRNTVAAYNKVLVEALAKPDAKLMQFFATPDEVGRIDSYILYFRKDGRILVSTLKDIDFRKVERDGATKGALVMTSEKWGFQQVDEKSRQPVTAEELISYNNVYHLVQQDGHWVVEKIDTNETTPKK